MTEAAPGPLQDLVVLVTGGSGGIGRAIVHAVARLGGVPIIQYGRNEPAATALLDEIRGRGWIVPADLSTPQGATELWTRAEALGGRIHGLINNAGVRIEARLDDELAAWQSAWERDLRVNLLSPVDLCRSAVRHFRRHGGGRIVNVASRAAQRGYVADFMPYGASKAGLINLTKSLARNYGAEGVISVAISPGLVDAGMSEDYVSEHGLAASLADNPLQAMVDPNELAELVAFCLLPSQRSLNGATLDVNGGSHVR